MGNSKALEFVVGLFVAAGFAALFVLAMKVSNFTVSNNEDGYTVIAKFQNIGSLKERASVTIGGVRIGRVTSISYDQDEYMTVVSLSINPEYNQLPIDTTASILTAGLLGEQYVGLDPIGAEDGYLEEGDEIVFVQDALVLENLIQKFVGGKMVEGDL